MCIVPDVRGSDFQGVTASLEGVGGREGRRDGGREGIKNDRGEDKKGKVININENEADLHHVYLHMCRQHVEGGSQH